MDTNELVTLKMYCATHGLHVGRARRMARKNMFPGTHKILDGVWAVERDAPVPEMPETSARGKQRDDGRKRYVVYINDAELAQLSDMLPNDAIVDVRAVAKTRRDARKSAETDTLSETDADGNPWANADI